MRFSYKILLSCYIAVNSCYAFSMPIERYINHSWESLTRSIETCAAYSDSKVKAGKILYLPYGFATPNSILKLKQLCAIKIAHLPRPIRHIGDVKTYELKPAGLLYLPHSYVVPGGRFNEMYGWDSYFIILGLLQDGKRQLAQYMLENYFFEINYYGSILNANRTYHLSRSQPPFLSSAVMAVYASMPLSTSKQQRQKWLSRAYQYIQRDYTQWVKPPFLAGKTGLSRYYDVENEPLIEANVYPKYYQHVMEFIQQHPELTKNYLMQIMGTKGSLTNDFYQGERSLRASGFDITFRFGPFGGETHHYAAVCLNNLLYKTEQDLAHIARLLHKNRDATNWEQRALQRKALMNQYFWNQKAGMFFDYNFVTNKRSDYAYATTFYPLWVNSASNEQAASLVRKLSLFEHAGGLAMSNNESGTQWDKPFGWAPIQLLTVQGLLHYGYTTDALRIAAKFNHIIENNYAQTGHIYEKYNVMTTSAVTKIKSGYPENVIGFGWTNATYLLFDRLAKKKT